MRAALNVLALDGQTDGGWADRVTDVVTLGSPHRGAPIAWGIGHGSRLLGLLPETSAFGRILDKRSEGRPRPRRRVRRRAAAAEGGALPPGRGHRDPVRPAPGRVVVG